MDDIFQKDLSGEMVSPEEPGYDKLINAIWDTMKLANELNTGYRTPDEVRDYLSRITVFPPLLSASVSALTHWW